MYLLSGDLCPGVVQCYLQCTYINVYNIALSAQAGIFIVYYCSGIHVPFIPTSTGAVGCVGSVYYTRTYVHFSSTMVSSPLGIQRCPRVADQGLSIFYVTVLPETRGIPFGLQELKSYLSVRTYPVLLRTQQLQICVVCMSCKLRWVSCYQIGGYLDSSREEDRFHEGPFPCTLHK